ncbi:MAG TPA: PAS-domain containing protein [Xanthobacteraceae bacterium]|jgi:signal transduction histidine kinase|nr:PAS-domain containing protein [Xanthobacteraceae bacterium]
MPDNIRANGGIVSIGLGQSGLRATLLGAFASAVFAPAAQADGAAAPLGAGYVKALAAFGYHDIAELALIAGVVCFAVLTSVMLVRTHARAMAADSVARQEIASLRAASDRAHALLLSEPQVLIAWPAIGEAAEIVGNPAVIGAADAPQHILVFESWLDPDQAHALLRAVENLRAAGEGFTMWLTTAAGRHLEAEGRILAGRAVLRLREASGTKRSLAELAQQHQKLQAEIEGLRTLVGALPYPVWTRDTSGHLSYANAAYARAVDTTDGAEAIARGAELLDHAARAEVLRVRAAGKLFAGRLPAVVAGARRVLDVVEVPTQNGSAALGIDVTEAETMRAELARMNEAHRRTLDQLSTGVAMFDSNHRLVFYNSAYLQLWDLDPAFLEDAPSDSAVLDRLRIARKLPEQQDFRLWKSQLHAAYREVEAKTHEWHLPDGRTMRVVTTPNPEGGVTYLFDDVTERLDLARRYDALIRVQGETLDNLAEAVAVFGSDGRVRLHNPAFARMWKLSPQTLAERPHIETVIRWCRPLYNEDVTWQALRAAVTALDEREPLATRFDRADGSVIDCATTPLPDGATLVTFQDITDSVNVERALRERNEALVAADEVKIDFVHHVSYELRSPLTNIIGFAHFLGDAATGPLNEKQREYLSYITVSTNALLAIINDILDLATIDAGAMKLNLGPVDVRRTMQAAAEGVQDRLVTEDIRLQIRTDADIGTFVADEWRIRQILFNLLSNAVGFSPRGETVTLSAERRPDAIVFSVSDRGPGIPSELKDRVFDWFETDSRGSHHRGLGLGLSIVRSFVELHGGTVRIDSSVGGGTTVICTFPLEHAAERTAAE